MTAPDAARAYVAAVNAGELGPLVRLFADDAVLRHPAGTFSGAEAIAGFYRDVVLAGLAVLRPGRVLADDRTVMFELEASSGLDDHRSTVRTVDVLTVDDRGAIAALDVYYG